ncbi:MAG: AraC family transcriptional regulator [Cellvibrionaceae bacterium]|nr:AraC family transcriptional regulator [Cellvibrionaceae bacterium]
MKTYSYQEPEFEVVIDNLSSVVHYLEHGAKSKLIRWHCHNEYELHLITSTVGKVFVGDYVGRFAPGHLLLVGPNLPHNWISDEDSLTPQAAKIRDKVIKFSQSTFDALYKILPELKEIAELLNAASYGVEFSGDQLERYSAMFDAVRDAEGLQRLIVFFELLQVLSLDSHQRQLSSREFRENAVEHNIGLVNKAVLYITANYTRTLSLNEVAEHVGMSSASAFSRFFHKSTGIKYSEFIKKLRVSKACERLEKSGDQITQICFDVGFSNVANFNRHFLVVTGMTPREYRERSQHKYSVST